MAEITLDQARPIIAGHLGVGPEKVTADAHLMNDLGSDSLDIVELALAFEDIGGAQISDERMEKIERVEQLVAAASGA